MVRFTIIALVTLGLAFAKQDTPKKWNKSSKTRHPKACKRCDTLLFSAYFSKDATRRVLKQRQSVQNQRITEESSSFYDGNGSFSYNDYYHDISYDDYIDDDLIKLDDYASIDDDATDDMDRYINQVNFISRISEISDIIYKSDDLRCILLNIIKTTRDIFCGYYMLDDDHYPYYSYEEEDTQEKRPDLNMNDIGDLMLAANFNKTLDEILHPFNSTSTSNNDGQRRKLMTDISNEHIEGLILWENLVDDAPQDKNFAYFFQNCDWYDIDQASCLLLFALARTVDASVCHYFQEKKCTLEKDCSESLKFRSRFNSKQMSNSMIAYPIPLFGTIVNDITGACDACIQEEYRCSALCNFADGYNKCSGMDFPFAL